MSPESTRTPIARGTEEVDEERCCMCRAITEWWTRLPFRAASEQVPICYSCAMQARPVMVPSKRAWFDLERARRWARVHPYPWETDGDTWKRVHAGIMRRTRNNCPTRTTMKQEAS